MTDRRQYDVISSEPSNPWISGISNLFTRDFFELARRRLAPGGILAQWFHVYGVTPGDVKLVLNTFRQVFPYVTAWLPSPGDLILIGSEAPHQLDYARLEKLLAEPDVQADLARVYRASPEQIVTLFALGGADLARYDQGAGTNTDDRPLLEFSAPRSLYADTGIANLRDLFAPLDGVALTVPVVGLASPGPGGFSAPALGLSVALGAEPTPGQWRSGWLVLHRLALGEATSSLEMSTISYRVLEWAEPAGRTQLTARYVSAEPSLQELDSSIQEPLAGRLAQAGSVDLPGGREGEWVLAAGEQPGQIVVAIAWTCADPWGGALFYSAFRDQADPGQAGWGPALLDLAGRFHCVQ